MSSYKMLSYIKFLLFFKIIALCSSECPYARLQNSYFSSSDGMPGYASQLNRESKLAYAEPYMPAPGAPASDITSFLQNTARSEPDNSYQSSINDQSSQYNEPVNLENMILKSYMHESKSDEQPKCSIPPPTCSNDTSNYYYRSYDGSCNNLQYPGWGMSMSRYTRLIAPKYGDGHYAPSKSVSGSSLPSARTLSLSVYGEDSRNDLLATYAFMQFGQLVAHDLSNFVKGYPDDCCANPNHKMCYPIPLDPHGPMAYGARKSCLSLARALSDADTECPASGLPFAEKLTSTTAWMDLGSIYGNNPEENARVREHNGGRMRMSYVNNRHWLPISMNMEGECQDNSMCYNIPDKRNEFMPTIIALHTVITREHNRLACALSNLNPHWSDEKIFQEARKINIAQFQKITYYDWLPLFLGSGYAYSQGLVHLVDPYEYVNDYDAYVHPGPYAEFAQAAFRYGHVMTPGWFSCVTPSRAYNSTWRLSDHMGRSSDIDFVSSGENMDCMLRGMVTQPQKRPDSNIDRELKHFFSRKENEEYGGDLKSMDIHRARDFGMPSYNDFRQYCGLPRARSWEDFGKEISMEKIQILQGLYDRPDDVEISIGGSLEIHMPHAMVGPTFQCIIGKQFSSTRRGDRFFFENSDVLSGFDRDQLAEIRKASLSGLFCNNGDYLQFIQPDAFVVPNPKNSLRSCNMIPQIDLSKWKDIQQHTIY